MGAELGDEERCEVLEEAVAAGPWICAPSTGLADFAPFAVDLGMDVFVSSSRS